jgi:hypothetical protein
MTNRCSNILKKGIFRPPTILYYAIKPKKMANNSFLATLYGEVAYTDGSTIGLYGNGFGGPVYESLPVVGTRVSSVPYQAIQTLWGTVYVNSLVEVFPMGLQIPAKVKRYICDATVATLNTART